MSAPSSSSLGLPGAAARRCRDCDAGLAHCHGTLVAHEDGSWECTDSCCEGPVLDHRWRVGCDELGGGCCLALAAAHAG